MLISIKCTTTINSNMRNMGIWTRTGIEVSKQKNKTINEHAWLTDGDSSIVILWFDRDGMPNVLIDDDDLSD